MSIESKAFRPLEPPEPWRSFLRALDSELKGAVTLRCLGVFLVTQQYGIGRSTGDIDFLSISTLSAEDDVEAVGGLGSSLYKRYCVYVQYVGIAPPPCDYAYRLQEMYPDSPWHNLRVSALDPADVALAKLDATQIGTERICLDWRAPVTLMQTC
jgi:hypothetical protein